MCMVQFRAIAVRVTRAVTALGARGQPPPVVIGPRFRRTSGQGHGQLFIACVVRERPGVRLVIGRLETCVLD